MFGGGGGTITSAEIKELQAYGVERIYDPGDGMTLGLTGMIEDLVRRVAFLARDPRAPTMVMVTHHVEEVPEGFTHGILLRRGAVLAAGPLAEVFTEQNLSKCFGVPLIVERRGARWAAQAAF